MHFDQFDAMTFDCYGTLIDWESGIVAALRPWFEAADTQMDESEVLETYGECEPRVEEEHPDWPYRRILAATGGEVARHYGLKPTEIELQAFGDSVQHWPAFPDSHDALNKLKQRFKLIVVSNIDHASFEHSRSLLGADFNAVVMAEDVGAYKPDVRMFEAAFELLDAIGVNRERTIHVAQSLFHDHVPAKALGLTTIHVDRRAGMPGSGATKPPEVDVSPDLTVKSMAELAEAALLGN